jgi:dienelactone hydrolase
MRRVTRTAIVVAVLLGAAVPRSAAADPVRFNSAPVNPTPLLRRLAELRGTVAAARPGDAIDGDLYRPAGPGPYPAVVVLHGCEGWPDAAARRQQAEAYVGQGFVFLAVDSFGPRKVDQECLPNPAGPLVDRLGDAYGALDWLGQQPFVDASRVGLVGASQGGNIVLSALSPFGSAQGSNHHFIGGAAFYPVCPRSPTTVTAPLLVLVGALDNWTPVSDCRAMVGMAEAGSAPQNLVILPGAHHAFDSESVRAHPREVLGYHLEYNAAAATAANAALFAFLRQVLKP